MLIPPAFKPGIEFTGGSAFTLEFEQAVEEARVREVLAQTVEGDATVQRLNDSTYFLRTRHLEEAVVENGQVVTPGGRERVLEAMSALAPIKTSQFDSVSPTIAARTVRSAAIAVAAASIVILFYITFAFRRVPNPFRYGVSAIVALLHNLLFVLGLTSFLGKITNFEVDAMFITALMTVMGYSVHDTIVVFDRIRENLLKFEGEPLEKVANFSLLETMTRSINTGMTTMIVMAAMMLLGGATVRNFLITLFAGFVVGTYSSIFVAAQGLVIWEKGELRRLLPFLPAPKPKGAEA
jgi:preprotein translocase subunit SecF